jgi:mRNA interferase MazF
VVMHGEVWWAELPDIPSHPVVVLTRPTVLPVLSRVVTAVVTSTIRGVPTEVPLDRGDGMRKPCVVSLDNLITLPRGLLTDRITRLSEERMHQICRALAVATGC